MPYTEMENLGGNQQWEKRIEDIVEKKEKGGGFILVCYNNFVEERSFQNKKRFC